MSRAPAFQFYYRDFVGDEHVMAMDLDAIGAHTLLMCAAAASPEGCRIPASERALRNIVRNPPPDDWQRMKEQLLGKAWKLTGDGQYYESKRLRQVIDNQREFSRQQSDRAQKRYRKPAEPVPDRSESAASRQLPEACSPSPSPSPKPIKHTPATDAAARVCAGLSLTGTKNNVAILEVLTLEVTKGAQTADQVADRMLEAWKRYKATSNKSFEYGNPVAFFRSSTWLTPDAWRGTPSKEELREMRRGAEASVGSRGSFADSAPQCWRCRAEIPEERRKLDGDAAIHCSEACVERSAELTQEAKRMTARRRRTA